MQPAALGELIVNRFVESFEFRNVALTLLTLKDSQKLKSLLNELGNALVSAVRPGPKTVEQAVRSKIAEAFLDAGVGAVRPLVDLIDLCTKLKDTRGSVGPIAGKILTLAGQMIVWHKADRKFESLKGLGVFAAALTSEADARHLDLGRPNYLKLKVAKGHGKSGWASFVYDELRLLIAPAHERVAEFVEQSGAVRAEDRSAVSQLWMAIDRAFQRLDRDATTLRTTLDDLSDNRHPAKKVVSEGERPRAEHLEAAANVAVPDTAFLDLLDQQRRQQARQLTATASAHKTAPVPVSSALPAKATPRLVECAKQLRAIEQSLQHLERTARSAVTHDTLGLGFRAIKPQPGMGDVKPQPGLGDLKPQPSMGGPKPQGPRLGAFSAAGSADSFANGVAGVVPFLMLSKGQGFFEPATNAALLAGLYELVAASFISLEEALVDVEDVAVTNGGLDGSKSGAAFTAAINEFRRALRTFDERLIQARRAVFAVIAHPTHGVGPGPQGGLNIDDRKELAAASGLSPQRLLLL